jgi:hypothetical protein
VLIDCQTCIAPASACRDCVVTFLLERPPVTGARTPEESLPPDTARIELDETEQAAIGSLMAAGLVPPLRLVSGLTPDSSALGREIA